MKIIKIKNVKCLVDEDDFDHLSQFNWYLNNKGYAHRVYSFKVEKKWKTKNIYMHREVVSAQKGFDVDHKNHNTLDNRKENLRVCEHHLNLGNRQKQKTNGGASKFHGVEKNNSGWTARIKFKNKRIYIGCFRTDVEAAIAYNQKAAELRGEFAHLNVIPKQFRSS